MNTNTRDALERMLQEAKKASHFTLEQAIQVAQQACDSTKVSGAPLVMVRVSALQLLIDAARRESDPR